MTFNRIAKVFLLAAGMVATAAAQNVVLSPVDSRETVAEKAASVRPNYRQIAWQRDEVSAFIHFGMNTFTDREWGDGTEDPNLFNPTGLDCRQWARAAKAAGISRLILTAKHHDGFCLWPSKYTEHSVRHSPWRDGKGDVVEEFVDACRAEGMHYGIYISPWDRHEPTYGDSPNYNQYFLNQLREVLSNYPGVQEVWFDGACAEGPNGKVQEYDWRAYWEQIRKCAPNAVISVRGPDVRWCGNEAGHTRQSEWSVIPMPGDERSWRTSDISLAGYTRDIYGDDLGSREALMLSRQEFPALAWYPAQVNTSIRPGWFYHENEDDRVRSLEDLLNVYYGSVGGNGQFLLNIPPDRRGLFHENDVARLKQFGAVLKATFSRNLAEGADLTLDVEGGEVKGGVTAVLDEDPDTFVTTTDDPKSLTIVVDLSAPRRANCLMLQEHIASGQRVESFAVESYTDGEWQALAEGSVIGHKRLLQFPETSISKFRVHFTHFRVRPTLASLGLYLAPALLSPPKIERDLAGLVTIVPPDGTFARYTLDGSPPSQDSARYESPIPMDMGGSVVARTFSKKATEGDPESEDTVARALFGMAKLNWKVIECDSEDGDAGRAGNAIDDNPNTFWHSRYRDGVDPLPHHLTIDLGRTATIKGFVYSPRQDQWDGGVILTARFEVSSDGEHWTVVSDDVDFDNVVNSRQQQVVYVPTSVPARFFRMTALRTVNGNGLASAAEISVLVE